ncbi:MAG: hypothetical protein AB8F95_11120 [Bacteroidia bacterium]
MLDFNVKTIIPWVILTLLTAYVWGLSYYSSHRQPPDPAINFYLQSGLHVMLHGADTSEVRVQGEFNNIIEGTQRQIQAVSKGADHWELAFELNSPRPARIYLNDTPLEVFLVQDSALNINAYFTEGQLDTVIYSGPAAGICQYLAAKYHRFHRDQLAYFRNTKFEDNPVRHARLLDSLSRHELAFLLEQATPNALPDWFVAFEKNEILFQRAYLKLTNAPAGEPYTGYYDNIPAQDEGAVFSYSYYLYIRTLIDRMGGKNASVSEKIAIADTLLADEPRDVFITRSLLSAWSKGDKETVRGLYEKFSPSFSKKKYARFLKMQMEG